MAGRRIIWSVNANREFIEILDFFNTRNGSTKYSLKLLTEVKDVLNTLSKSPFIGRLTVNQKIRVLVFKQYLIFYEININNIEIVSFWDNRQDGNNRIIV